MTFVGFNRKKTIDDLRHIRYALQELGKRYEERLWAVQTKIEKSCDHKLPDGKSAWKGTFMMTECTICGENDL